MTKTKIINVFILNLGYMNSFLVKNIQIFKIIIKRIQKEDTKYTNFLNVNYNAHYARSDPLDNFFFTKIRFNVFLEFLSKEIRKTKFKGGSK